MARWITLDFGQAQLSGKFPFNGPPFGNLSYPVARFLVTNNTTNRLFLSATETSPTASKKDVTVPPYSQLPVYDWNRPQLYIGADGATLNAQDSLTIQMTTDPNEPLPAMGLATPGVVAGSAVNSGQVLSYIYRSVQGMYGGLATSYYHAPAQGVDATCTAPAPGTGHRNMLTMVVFELSSPNVAPGAAGSAVTQIVDGAGNTYFQGALNVQNVASAVDRIVLPYGLPGLAGDVGANTTTTARITGVGAAFYARVHMALVTISTASPV